MLALLDRLMKDILPVYTCILFLHVAPYLEDGRDNLTHGSDILYSILLLASLQLKFKLHFMLSNILNLSILNILVYDGGSYLD